jgi:hypothetical protein
VIAGPTHRDLETLSLGPQAVCRCIYTGTGTPRMRSAISICIPGRLGGRLLAAVVDLHEVGPLGAARQVDAGQRAACPVSWYSYR